MAERSRLPVFVSVTWENPSGRLFLLVPSELTRRLTAEILISG